MPNHRIATWCVALTPAQGSVNQLSKNLRSGSPAVFGRVHQDRLLLDLRSVLPAQDMQIVDALASLDGPAEPDATAGP